MTGKHQMKGTRVEHECRNDLDTPTAYICLRPVRHVILEERFDFWALGGTIGRRLAKCRVFLAGFCEDDVDLAAILNEVVTVAGA